MTILKEENLIPLEEQASNINHDDLGKSKRIAAYRRYAGISEDFIIDESNIDMYALNRVSCEHVCDRDRVKAELLGEEWSD